MTVQTNVQNHAAKFDVYNKQANFQKRSKSAIALKRYLDLSLSGSRKNLAVHGRGKKEHPLSPYTFDRPEIEKSVRTILQTPVQTKRTSTAPQWINQINQKVVTHTGEAPLFAEKFLSPKKNEQETHPTPVKPKLIRPLSGVSTKSAPIIVNGGMYYRPSSSYKFLQASSRPTSAKQDRLTRTYELRQKHRSQSMSALPSDDTREELQRKKHQKPKRRNLNKDLLPIPCHTGETPHSFIIGARYNYSHFMDSRSFSRFGLYLSRQNGAFLKSYKGVSNMDVAGSGDSDVYLGKTSVQTPGSNEKFAGSYSPTKLGFKYSSREKPLHHPNAQLPNAHLKTVVKEAWLKGEMHNLRMTPSTGNVLRTTKTNQPHPKSTRDLVLMEMEREARFTKEQNIQNETAKENSEEVKTETQLLQQKIDSQEMLNRLHIKTPTPDDKQHNSKQTIEAVLPKAS